MVIEWRYNEEGQKLRVTTRYRIKRQVKKLKPEVIRRRSLKKFGDASHQVREESKEKDFQGQSAYQPINEPTKYGEHQITQNRMYIIRPILNSHLSPILVSS